MHYVALLYGPEGPATEPGTPEFDAELAGYDQFDRTAGEHIVAGEALAGSDTAVTVRHGEGGLLVTDGPYAETTEVLGGFFVLEADGLDDVIELARHIPAAVDGCVELRPIAEWSDESSDVDVPDGASRYLATIHGAPADPAVEEPGTAAWEAGVAGHQRFAEAASGAVLAGMAVHPSSTATTLRVRNGEVLLSDGPYAEGAEVVGGCYLLWAGDRAAAVDLAAEIPVNPGGAVELRPVLELE